MLEFNPVNIRTWSRLGQRGTLFGTAISDLADQFDDLMVVTADLAYLSGLDRFIKAYPERFVNTGIAEQNMLGISAGLAQEGKLVFATTYATFVTMRSCEQMRHYLGYMQSNVKIVGSGAGLVMSWSGNTHYAMEDMAIARSIPGIVVLSPADAAETVKAASAAALYQGPVYIRLTGGLNHPMVYREDYPFEIGKAIPLTEKGEVTLFATGSMVYNALKAKEILITKGIEAEVVNIHTIKPLDTAFLNQRTNNSALMVSVEEHSVIGGLGGAIAEHLSSLDTHPPLMRMGIKDHFMAAGDYEYLLGENELLPEQIAANIEKRLLGIG